MSSLESLRFAQAADTASAASPTDAVAAAQRRMDAAVEEAPTRERWDCGVGCAACCRLQVFVHPLEADVIAAWVKGQCAEEDRAELVRRIDETAQTGRSLDAGGWRRARLACAFLDESERCRIYALRPLKCRAHVSRDVTACDEPTSPVPMDDWLVKAAEAVLHGLGEDARREELHAALARRLR